MTITNTTADVTRYVNFVNIPEIQEIQWSNNTCNDNAEKKTDAKYDKFIADIERSSTKMNKTLNEFSIDNIKSETVMLKIGSKMFNLTPLADTSVDSMEASIKEEYKTKIEKQLVKIRDRINEEKQESIETVKSFISEYDRKEKKLKELLAKSSPMPDVLWEHAVRGLSIVKGDSADSLVWLIRRVYNPKFVDRKPIDPIYVKKMITNIYIMINTTGNKITRVSTRYIKSLEYFSHYHQVRPDCWGSWAPPATWTTPEDILSIADKAEAVLENINTMSIGNRAPALLPRLRTLTSHVLRNTTPTQTASPVTINAVNRREGLSTLESADQDAWSN
jgi:hypothetical protein